MAQGRSQLAAVTLDDKYILEKGRVYLTGTQALVRLPMVQRQRDAAAGLNTGCFIAGYRGSPLGGLDQALWGARRFIERNHIRFQPAINEEMAATAVWGSQQLGLFPGAKYDGVFAMWYGKGPGVDRSGDALKHGNSAGSAPHGGVLAAGRRRPHLQILDPGAPVGIRLHRRLDPGPEPGRGRRDPRSRPLRLGDVALFGVLGRVQDRRRIDGQLGLDRGRSGPGRDRAADDFEMPPGGLNIRWPDPPLEQELRLHRYKLAAAVAFARANRLDRIVIDAPAAALWHRHDRQILSRRAPGARRSRHRRRRGGRDRPAPLQGGDAVAARTRRHPPFRRRARGSARRRGEARRHRNPAQGAALQLAGRSAAADHRQIRRGRRVDPAVERRTDADRDRPRHRPAPGRASAVRHGSPSASPGSTPGSARRAAEVVPFQRTPYFCSGCPHNTSTRVPEGSRALAGIGCHYLAQFMDRETATFTQMGGEGVPWIGQAPFTETRHVFANIGDGTYTHSGILAIRVRGRRQGQHDLQDPVQRRRRDDRRPAARRRPDRADRDPSARRRRRAADRRRHRRARQISARDRIPARHHGAPPRRTRCGAARVARIRRRHRDRLRPDLRRREAPPQEARPLSRPAAARRHQRSGLRGLRRLLGDLELPVGGAGRDRVRTQARDRPVELQQGFFLPQRLLPELCHRRRRRAAGSARPAIWPRTVCRRCPNRRCRTSPNPTAFSSPGSAAPAS